MIENVIEIELLIGKRLDLLMDWMAANILLHIDRKSGSDGIRHAPRRKHNKHFINL